MPPEARFGMGPGLTMWDKTRVSPNARFRILSVWALGWQCRTKNWASAQVIIAGAGGAAHLPGMVAALTPLPVIGVPVKPAGAHLDGLDALLSIVQVTSHPWSHVRNSWVHILQVKLPHRAFLSPDHQEECTQQHAVRLQSAQGAWRLVCAAWLMKRPS